MTNCVWDKFPKPRFDAAEEHGRPAEFEADVCVVGTGIGGMTAAYRLAKAGKQIVLVGDGGFCSGETSRTTAQISTIHDDNWSDMEDIHGTDGIKICADSYKEALAFIRGTVASEGIECALETLPAYVFLTDPEDADWPFMERDAALRAGLSGVEVLDFVPGLLVDGPVLAYRDQAQFHPVAYISGLASILEKMPNVRIFTGTRVIDVDDNPEEVRAMLDNGSIVLCRSLIMATNVPTHHRFIPIEALAPYRSYVIGCPIPKGALLNAQYSDNGDPYHYVRIVPNNRFDYGIDYQFDCLLIGGEDHRVGDTEDAENRFTRLFEWARQKFPIEQSIAFRWSAQTIETFDGMPLLGRCPGDSKNVYIITGDSGTGMTHATIGGLITSDLILGKTTPKTDFFSPARRRTKSLKSWIRENAASFSQYRDWITPGEVDNERDILPGSGAVLRCGLKKCAVYKSASGTMKRFSAVCPHLRALVRWNPVEHTWDCPAHGSRFDVNGNVLNGPAPCGLTSLDESYEEEEKGAGRDKNPDGRHHEMR